MTDPRLFVRDAELAVLAELIEHARERGSALAVLGGAGIGKSTLLRAAVEQARSAGFQVLQTAGVTGRTPMKGMAVMFKSTSTSLILRGVLAIIVGIIALAWPSVTILALVTLFAIYAFIDAGLQATRAFSSAKAGPVVGHLLLGLIDLAAGVVALAWPGPTALLLVLVVGIWAVTGGAFEIAAAFGAGESAGTRAMFILAGLVSIAFGVVLFSRPGVGAVALALLFGLFTIMFGVSLIVIGVELRRTGRTLHSVLDKAA